MEFSEIMLFIQKELEQAQKKNKREYESAFPDYETLTSGQKNVKRPGALVSRAAGHSHILELQHFLHLDIECYQQKRSEHSYQVWSYIPGTLPPFSPCLLFQADQNRNLLHRHNFTELIYVYEGTYTVEIEGELCVFSQNDICLVNASCEHREIETSCQGLFIYLGFRPEENTPLWKKNLHAGILRRFLFPDKRSDKQPRFLMLTLPEENNQEAMRFFCRMFEELYRRDVEYNRICHILLIRFLNFLETYGMDKAEKNISGDHSILLYQEIVSYIQEHLATVSLSELKQVFHYQEDYYNRLIRKIDGQSFRSFVHHQKMEAAKKLLQETGHSIQDIMQQLGFHSKPHFYDCFKKETGTTPAKFRKTT